MRMRFIMPLAAVVALAGCSSDDYDYGDYRRAFVTYNGSADGYAASYLMQGRDDQPTTTLYSSAAAPSDIEEGDRCLLQYTELAVAGDYARSIRTDYVAEIPYDVIRTATPAQMAALSGTEITVTSFWRTGTILNLSGWVPYSGEKFQLMLVADATTVDSSVVEARLVYSLLGATATFERRVYASFDVTNAWTRTTCDTLRVAIGSDTYDFVKQN